MSDHAENMKPWHQQFWPWFLITLPSITVIGCIVTITIAILSPNAKVVDDVAKIGMSVRQNQVLDENAKRLGLNASLNIDEDTQMISLVLTSDKKNAVILTMPHLILLLSHPTLQAQDKTIILTQQNDNRFISHQSMSSNNRWNIVLQPEDISWRLQGELAKHQNTLRLHSGKPLNP